MIITTRVCDRCKKETDKLREIYEFAMPENYAWTRCFHEKFSELCPDCWEKFKAFLSGVE